jgi:hypothetical protein
VLTSPGIGIVGEVGHVAVDSSRWQVVGCTPRAQVIKNGRKFAKIINSLKSVSARKLFGSHPELKEKLWKGQFWSRSYFLATTGEVSLDVLKQYVEANSSSRRANAVPSLSSLPSDYCGQVRQSQRKNVPDAQSKDSDR